MAGRIRIGATDGLDEGTDGVVMPLFLLIVVDDPTLDTFLDDIEQPDAQSIARFMREIGDWLSLHHYNVAMPVVPFCIQQTEDDEQQFLERCKYPRFRVIVDDECTAHELAVALHKASEYLHKRSGKGGLK